MPRKKVVPEPELQQPDPNIARFHELLNYLGHVEFNLVDAEQRLQQLRLEKKRTLRELRVVQAAIRDDHTTA